MARLSSPSLGFPPTRQSIKEGGGTGSVLGGYITIFAALPRAGGVIEEKQDVRDGG